MSAVERKRRPLLSIILPMHNAEDYIDSCLTSLVDQDLDASSYEIIIINDGSTDGSMKIAKEYAEKYTNIQIINNRMSGAGSARNAGILLSKGKYIHFVDADDYVAGEVYGALLTNIMEYDLEIMFFKFRRISDNTIIRESENDGNVEIEEIVNGIDYIASKGYINTCWISLINRDFLLGQKLLFSSFLFEDITFMTSLISSASRVANFPYDVYRYRINNTNSISNKKTDFHLKRSIISYHNVVNFFNDLVDTKRKEGIQNLAYFESLARLRNDNAVSMLLKLIKSRVSLSTINKLLTSLFL